MNFLKIAHTNKRALEKNKNSSVEVRRTPNDE